METFNKPSQRERLLKLLKERGRRGVYVYEIMAPWPSGCGIAQYGARILELRRRGYDIKNVTPGHFVLEEKIEEPKEIKAEQKSFL